MSTPADVAELTLELLDDLHRPQPFRRWIGAVERVLVGAQGIGLRPAVHSDPGPGVIRIDRMLPPVVASAGEERLFGEPAAAIQAGLRSLVAQARDHRCLDEMASLRSNADLPSIAQSIADLARILTGSTGSIVWSVDAERRRLLALGLSGAARQTKPNMPVDAGIAGAVAIHRKSASTADLPRGVRVGDGVVVPFHTDTVSKRGWKSAFFLPLIGDSSDRLAVGVIAIYSPVQREFGPLPIRRLKAMSVILEASLASARARTAQAVLEVDLEEQKTAREYYQAKIRQTHDAGKQLIPLANSLLLLRAPAKQAEEAENAPAARRITPEGLHQRLVAIAGRIQTNVRASMPTGEERLRRAKVDLAVLASNYCTGARLVLDTERIDLTFHDRSGEFSPKVLGNTVALTDCIANLVDNSLYFTRSDPKPGRRFIRVVVDATSEYVDLSVEDDGPGIPESELEAIFEAGFTTKPDTGAGIGLASVKRLIGLQDGTVAVESDWGFGAKFTLRLPRVWD